MDVEKIVFEKFEFCLLFLNGFNVFMVDILSVFLKKGVFYFYVKGIFFLDYKFFFFLILICKKKFCVIV